MNYEAARTTLVGLVEAALTAYPWLEVAWDNVDIDLDKVGDTCLAVEFMWDDAGQINLGVAPEHRTTGSLFLTVLTKEGTGTKGGLQLMDALTAGLKCKQQNGLTTTVPKPGRPVRRQGWKGHELHVPFYFDSTN